jgi:hypothetical protein
MPIRNAHKVGDYLMTDDESGIVYYASEMVKRWDGQFVHKSQNEFRHPQEFVKALNDPRALRDIRPDGGCGGCDCADCADCGTACPLPCYIGETNIPFPTNSPGARALQQGVGEASIGATFRVG